MTDRIKINARYANSPSYNASGKLEHYELDLPLQCLVDFQQLWYYDPNTWGSLKWMGVPIQKYPTDLLILQEIIWEMEPEVIVECGTFSGGSALYMAHLCDILKNGRVITIDTVPQPNRPVHDRIYYLRGSSVDPLIVNTVREKMAGKTLLILDSLHTKEHVFAELKAYSAWADYIIVEDTNINGHPVRPDFGPGPYEAVQQFLSYKIGAEWQRDTERERLHLTANPGGFLKRV